jgi:hypothetical protein
MRTFLARCTMLGLLVGGFALTGDAGWILAKGRSLLNATTVSPVADSWDPQQSALPMEPKAGFTSSGEPFVGPVEVPVAPSPAVPAEGRLVGGGEAVVDLRLLRPGERVRLWVNGSQIMFDIVDPATGEAIQQPVTRRVRISGTGDPHRIERGGMIDVQPRAGISGHQPPTERVGPLQAIGLEY